MRGVQVWPPWWEQRQMVSEVRNKDDAPTGQEVGRPAMSWGRTAQARLLGNAHNIVPQGRPTSLSIIYCCTEQDGGGALSLRLHETDGTHLKRFLLALASYCPWGGVVEVNG